MKYVVLVGDGMADYPIKELGNKTPLEFAKTSNIDYLAQNGICGTVSTIPSGMPKGSDVAALSLLGYNPRSCYTGRAPLEAANIGVSLKKNEIAFRCNLITTENGMIKDYSAGHITSEEGAAIIRDIDERLGNAEFKFYTGVSYRHLTVSTRALDNIECTPPHDIQGRKIDDYLPNGDGADHIIKLMKASIPILENHPVNTKRIKIGKNPANMIWLWGQGRAPELQSFKSKYSLNGSVISAVDLLKGIGHYIGLKVIDVPGATGFVDTNYEGKASYGLRALNERDFLLLHVEAPDEAAHNGDLPLKIKAIEDFDAKIVGPILKGLSRFPEFKLIVLPDHPTPISLRTHTDEPVPFVIYSSGNMGNMPGFAKKLSGFREFREDESALNFPEGHTLLPYFISF